MADANKNRVIKAGGVEVVLNGLRKHGNRADVTERACALIQNIAVFGTPLCTTQPIHSPPHCLITAPSCSAWTREAGEAGREHLPDRRHAQPPHPRRYAPASQTASFIFNH